MTGVRGLKIAATAVSVVGVIIVLAMMLLLGWLLSRDDAQLSMLVIGFTALALAVKVVVKQITTLIDVWEEFDE